MEINSGFKGLIVSVQTNIKTPTVHFTLHYILVNELNAGLDRVKKHFILDNYFF